MSSTTSDRSNITFVDSEASLLLLLDSIVNLAVDPPSLYIDLEGINLGRHGSISIVSLYIAPSQKTYLIDIHSLGRAAFSTTTNRGTSLKTVLESSTIPKVVFDIRNDSDALFSLFQISVDGIKDLQLLELATRTGSRNYVSGLAKCIEQQSPISAAAKTEWRLAKDRCQRLFIPDKGGRYEVFNERPLRPELIWYCKADVALLPGLYGVYTAKLRPAGQAFWRVTVRNATKDRIKQSQSPRYDGNSKSKVLGWDSATIDAMTESWNEDIMMEAFVGEEEEEPEDDWYEDSARDCIGWEEDMIKNGEMF
ncbi:MAG: hypothetical protein M1818_007374 [Claussenomyces sp. TS43310]|nr:MAG: hypothetical protein M1818_007374 [Claussenomyces sp. TS43310]